MLIVAGQCEKAWPRFVPVPGGGVAHVLTSMLHALCELRTA